MANIIHVANGRRLATRRIVMKTTSTLYALCWRKEIVYSNQQNTQEPEDPLSYEAMMLSQQDEPHYRYNYFIPACVLFDKYNGGYLHDNDSMNNPHDITITAQIELYDDNLDESQRIKNIPDEQLKIGDLIAVQLPSHPSQEPISLWFEVVGITGQSLIGDFGKKFVLNRRDDLMEELFS